MITSYIKHLEKSSRYKQVEQLERILELISICNTRRTDEIETSKQLYGLTPEGHVKTTTSGLKRVEKYFNIERRLKLYYNNKLDKLTKFR